MKLFKRTAMDYDQMLNALMSAEICKKDPINDTIVITKKLVDVVPREVLETALGFLYKDDETGMLVNHLKKQDTLNFLKEIGVVRYDKITKSWSLHLQEARKTKTKRNKVIRNYLNKLRNGSKQDQLLFLLIIVVCLVGGVQIVTLINSIPFTIRNYGSLFTKRPQSQDCAEEERIYFEDTTICIFEGDIPRDIYNQDKLLILRSTGNDADPQILRITVEDVTNEED